MIVAGAHLFFCGIELLYIIIVQWMLGGSATPQHCHGPKCGDILTCRGMVEGSFETHRILFLMGGVYFGYMGERGAVNGHATGLYQFACFLYSKVALIVFFALWDGAYYGVCNAYPWNVVYESVMMPIPNFPMLEQQKAAIYAGTRWLPVGFLMNEVLESKIWPAYFVRMVPELLFYLYVGSITIYLAEHTAFGVYGLGANMNIYGNSMNNWREGLIVKGRHEETWLQAKQDARDMQDDFNDRDRRPPQVRLPPGNYYEDPNYQAC